MSLRTLFACAAVLASAPAFAAAPWDDARPRSLTAAPRGVGVSVSGAVVSADRLFAVPRGMAAAVEPMTALFTPPAAPEAVFDWDAARGARTVYRTMASAHRELTPLFLRHPALADESASDVLAWWLAEHRRPEAPEPIDCDSYIDYRAVADVRVPENRDQMRNQLAELEHWRSLGYNAAVLTVTGEPDMLWMEETAAQLSRDGWTLILAPAVIPWDRNKQQGTLYIEPERWTHCFELLAPYCDFALSGWRGLSNGAHWGDGPDAERLRRRDLAALHGLLRDAAPRMPVLGEAWFSGGDEPRAFRPGWTDGVVLGNAGHIVHGVRPKPDGFREWAGNPDPLFAVITGGKPHWSTRERDDWRGVNFKKARRLEKAFLDAGYNGTITLVGAGNLEYDDMRFGNFRGEQ